MFTTEMMMAGCAGVALISMILAIAALCRMSALNKKYKSFMAGRNGKSLEDAILEKMQTISELQTDMEKSKEEIQVLFSKSEKTICKVGISKYDAFNESGGKLSFALVMLDEGNNGFSMNSMHGQEGSYVYVKEIINGQSYIELGDEEKKALTDALGIKEQL